jgi:hypothetical protein
MKHCLNCGTLLRGEYCYKCGGQADKSRITGKYLLEEIFHFFTHVEHGFLYTSKEILLRPGKTLHQYLNGKRKRFQQPVSYIIIWITIEWLIRSQIVRHFHYISIPSNDKTPRYNEVKMFYDDYSSLFIFILTPLLGLIYFLILGKPRYNFYEMIVINIYGYGTYFILQLLFSTILLGLIFHINTKSFEVGLFTSFIAICWASWSSYDFFKTVKMKFFRLKLISTILIAHTASTCTILFFPISWIHFFKNQF